MLMWLIFSWPTTGRDRWLHDMEGSRLDRLEASVQPAVSQQWRLPSQVGQNVFSHPHRTTQNSPRGASHAHWRSSETIVGWKGPRPCLHNSSGEGLCFTSAVSFQSVEEFELVTLWSRDLTALKLWALLTDEYLWLWSMFTFQLLLRSMRTGIHESEQ